MVIKHTAEYYVTAIKDIEAMLLSNGSTDQNTKLNLIKLDLDSDIVTVHKSLVKTLEQISELKKEKASIVSKLQSNMDKRNGSVGMYDDSRAMYNSKLLENYILFLSICAISYFTMLQ